MEPSFSEPMTVIFMRSVPMAICYGNACLKVVWHVLPPLIPREIFLAEPAMGSCMFLTQMARSCAGERPGPISKRLLFLRQMSNFISARGIPVSMLFDLSRLQPNPVGPFVAERRLAKQRAFGKTRELPSSLLFSGYNGSRRSIWIDESIGLRCRLSRIRNRLS